MAHGGSATTAGMKKEVRRWADRDRARAIFLNSADPSAVRAGLGVD